MKHTFIFAAILALSVAAVCLIASWTSLKPTNGGKQEYIGFASMAHPEGESTNQSPHHERPPQGWVIVKNGFGTYAPKRPTGEIIEPLIGSIGNSSYEAAADQAWAIWEREQKKMWQDVQPNTNGLLDVDENCIAIGVNAEALGRNAIAIGDNSKAASFELVIRFLSGKEWRMPLPTNDPVGLSWFISHQSVSLPALPGASPKLPAEGQQ